jgi:hypothetical protein
MIFSWKHVEPLSLKNEVFLLNGIIDCHLIGALTYLTLAIEHETTSERIDLVVVWAGAVALASLY